MQILRKEIHMTFKLKSMPKAFLVFGLIFIFASSLCLMAGIEKTIKKSFEVQKGGELFLDTDLGSIEVVSHKSDVVKVEVILKANTSIDSRAKEIFEDFKVDFQKKGKDVKVEAEYEGNKGWSLFKSWRKKLKVKFLVKVPGEYDLELKTSGGSISVSELKGEVNARTSGGSLAFEYVDGTVLGRTSGGSIRLEGCSGDAEVRTSGGGIRIGKVKGNVIARTSGGSIKVKEVMGKIDASTSGGSVTAYISKQPTGNCRLKTSGGSVTVKLNKDVKIFLDARTSGGRVRTDLPITIEGTVSKRSLKGKINGGGPELYLRSSGGSIYINKI
jgi:DUF4097 and DUF4098 domain-containing protein YvlB